MIINIEQNQLTWYGHVQTMAEGRLPKIALKWMSKQKRARGRSKKNWMEGIKKAINERNLNEDQWEDRKQWSLCVGQCRKTFRNRYTYIHIWNSKSSVAAGYFLPGRAKDLSAPLYCGLNTLKWVYCVCYLALFLLTTIASKTERDPSHSSFHLFRSLPFRTLMRKARPLISVVQ